MGQVCTAQELKGLQVQLEKENAEGTRLKTEIAALQRKLNLSQTTSRSVQNRIAELQSQATEPIVSEHALLRYLERVRGVDMDALREEILGNGTAEAIAFAGNARIKKGQVCLVVKNKVVVTVETEQRCAA